jgi:ANTAR domain
MSGADGLYVSQRFRAAIEELAGLSDLDHRMRRFVELAQKTAGHGEAAVWTPSSRGHLNLTACTDGDLMQALVSIQRIHPHPADECFEQQTTVELPDLAHEYRWPEFTLALTRATPVRSAVAIFLGSSSRPVGVLMLVASESDAYPPQVLEAIQVFAALACPTLEAAIQDDRAHHLQVAVATNRRIGMAIGIVMALHRVDEPAAFAMLRRASQGLQRKLRDVAESVILTGEVPAASIE